MSEMEQSEQPSAPQSTMDIAEQVVSQSESESEPVEESAAPEPVAVPPPTPAELSAAAKFLQSQGHKIHKDDGKPNWLPAPTVEKMLSRFMEQEGAGWNTRYTGLETEHKTLKEQHETYRALVDLADRDPDAFIAFVAQHDPRYQRYLPQEKPPQVEDPEPQPPKDANGNPIYTADWLMAVRQWDQREAVRKFEAKQEAKQKEADQQRQRAESGDARKRQILDAVQAKPEFGKFAADGVLTPFQQEVYDTFKANPTMTLMEAYYDVKERKSALAEGAAREKLVQDINAAPTSTSVTRSSSVVAPPTVNRRRTTEEIAREVIAKMEA